MVASIRSTLLDSPGGLPVIGAPVLVGVSRDDLRAGYQVELESVNVATFYEWVLEFTPQAPDGTPSAAVMLTSAAQIAHFNVDFEGPYLVKLTVDKTLPTEDIQYVRMRFLTRFADVHLIAGGERRDTGGVIPVDVDAEGWSHEQNQNIQRMLALTRRQATSGRSLYVDANRGRNSTNTPNDTANSVDFPGSDPLDPTGSGISADTEGFGDFSSVQAAIDYAMDYAVRGEPAPSFTDPYFVFIQPGLYVEDLTLQPHVHLVGLGAQAPLDVATELPATFIYPQVRSVVIRTRNLAGATHEFSPPGGMSTDVTLLQGLLLENTDVLSTQPVLKQTNGLLILQDCGIDQQGTAITQEPAFSQVTAGPAINLACYAYNTRFRSMATGPDQYAVSTDAPRGQLWLTNCRVYGRGAAIKANESLYATSTNVVYLRETIVTAESGGSYAVRSCASLMLSLGCQFTGQFVLDAFGAGPKIGSIAALFRRCYLGGVLVFDTASATGGKQLHLDATQLGAGLSYPSGAPTQQAGTAGQSLKYDRTLSDPAPPGLQIVPTISRLAATDVQAAFDELTSKVNPFYHHAPVTVTTTPYLVLSPNSYLGVDTTVPASPIDIVLPDAEANGAVDGRVLYIKDEGGSAGVLARQINVYIAGATGTIDGVVRNIGAPLVLNTNFASLTLMCRGISVGTSHWFII